MTAKILYAARRRFSLKLPVRLWITLSRGRSRLAQLDSHMLADIGLTQHLAATEAARPFWDAPAHWRG